MKEPQDPKNKLTLEQIKQLMAMQQAAGAQRPQSRAQRFLNAFFQKSQKLIVHLDRFVNFITKKNEENRNEVVQAARSPILFGIYVILIFVVFGGLWATIAPLNSAAVCIGSVVAGTNKKIIQHQEGGIIKNIFVKQGDLVKKGDKLIELEETVTKSRYENTLNEYRSLLANESRLIAERDRTDKIDFPEFLIKDISLPEVEKVINTQENLFRSNVDLYKAKKETAKKKIEQLQKDLDSFRSKKKSSEKIVEVNRERLSSMRQLLQKNFVQKAAVSEQEARLSQAESDLYATESKIAQVEQDISRAEIEFLSIENEINSRILSEFKENQVRLTQAREQYSALTDALKRIVVTSPVDGIINTVRYHTIGGVIGQGAPIMEISPINDSLVIEAKVPHKNIDVVHTGLVAKIRFSAFKSRITPLFTGKVVSLSPDIVQDENRAMVQDPNQPYYMARIEIDMEEFKRLAAQAKNIKLFPGMQAEVQIITGTKTLFRYLLDPLTDVMFRAFREK